MVRLEEHKHSTEHKPIEKAQLPGRVYIPLSQHVGKICNPLVKAGDSVFLGQEIASSSVHVFSPIHASVSGKVFVIDDCPHPVLGRCKAIIIDNDGFDKSQGDKVPATIIGGSAKSYGGTKSQKEVDNLSVQQIRDLVFKAGVVGMGGASFPTHIKLTPPKPVDTLIINGAECEPYLNSDNRLMIEKTREIILGISLVVKCTAVKKVYFAIEENKPEAISLLKKELQATGYELKILKSKYPQGGEKQLSEVILKREVPRGKLPFDIGVIVQNVATVNAIYEAVYLNKPLYERVVTVTGESIENPKNLLVRIGTPVSHLVSLCGSLKKEPKKVIFGGPMMGMAQFNLETPVIKSTNGIIFLPEVESSAEEILCIRCSRCVQYCPLGLMPCLIALASQKEKWDLAKAYGCADCMECGLCNYVCPQKINIVQQVKYAKTRMPR